MAKKLITWVAIAFLVFFVAYNPGPAAGVAKSIGNGIMGMARGFGAFFTSLFS